MNGGCKTTRTAQSEDFTWEGDNMGCPNGQLRARLAPLGGIASTGTSPLDQITVDFGRVTRRCVISDAIRLTDAPPSGSSVVSTVAPCVRSYRTTRSATASTRVSTNMEVNTGEVDDFGGRSSFGIRSLGIIGYIAAADQRNIMSLATNAAG